MADQDSPRAERSADKIGLVSGQRVHMGLKSAMKKPLPPSGAQHLPDLMRRLNVVYTNCGGQAKTEELQINPNMDDFQKAKFTLAQLIHNTRKKIKARDDMNMGGNDKRSLVLINQEIRKAIAQIKEEGEKLQQVHERMSKKPLISSKIKLQEHQEATRKRQEQLDVVKQHIREVEQLDQRRFERKGGGGTSSSRTSELLGNNKGSNSSSSSNSSSKKSGSGSNKTQSKGNSEGGSNGDVEMDDQLPSDPTDTNLPDIDISDCMIQIKEKDQKIDAGLDQISARVKKLGQIALEMNTELKVQEQIMTDIDKSIDKNQEKIENLNRKLENALEQQGGMTRFIAVLLLIVIVLALVGVAYTVISNYFKNFLSL